jgi:hypothetical protein
MITHSVAHSILTVRFKCCFFFGLCEIDFVYSVVRMSWTSTSSDDLSVVRRSGTSTSSGELISLNVGGTIFVTSAATLTKDHNSMLARMFGGSELPPARTDGDGNYFLDRDPETFRVILSFLGRYSVTVVNSIY